MPPLFLFKKNGSEELRGRTGIKTQTQRMDLRTQGVGRVTERSERVAWTYIHYQM